MAKDIALITLHGMGDYKPDYYHGLKKKLSKSLGLDWFKVSFQPVQYQPILQKNQNEIWQRMNRFPLDGSLLRRFLLFGFSDAGSMEYSARSTISEQYKQVQQEIVKALDKAYTDLEDPSKPVIVIAQSLGCQVISNYLWDAHHGLGVFASPEPSGTDELKAFRKLKTCVYLLTTGCNIPMFVAGLDPIKALPKPNDTFVWENYFDRDDVLGWPLSPLSPSYKKLVTDYEINAGGVFSSWTPWSHGKYWTDKQIINPLLTKIRQYL